MTEKIDGRKGVYKDRKCDLCGSLYQVNIKNKRSMEKKSCSQSCSAKLAYLRTRVDVNCTICGSKTTTTKSHIKIEVSQFYCSDECRGKRHENECVICNQKFRADRKQTKFCSRECLNTSNESNIRTVICFCCSQEFTRPTYTLPSNKRFFCSKRCGTRQYSRENPNRYGSKWTRIRERKIKADDYTCQICNERKTGAYELNVHHRIPIQNFKNIDDANIDKNLQTLCYECHMELHDRETNNT